MKKEIGIFILLVALCTVTAIINPLFLSATNLTNMANIIGMFGIFSIGLGLVIISGGIDLSVGSMFALAGVLLQGSLLVFGAPFLIAGGLMAIYDLALWRLFRRVRLPED